MAPHSSPLELNHFAEVGNKVADAAGEIIRKYFRKNFDVIHKHDLSPVTIADQSAEEAMVSIILDSFPSHAIYGEENGWRCKEKNTDYVWVLDPIDGTKSFITGKPVFGSLVALLQNGTPILGIIDQPVLRERWIGITGKRTTLNGQEISTRTCIPQAHICSVEMQKRHSSVLEARLKFPYMVVTAMHMLFCLLVLWILLLSLV
uniref:Histidinol-phosphatase n=1 Tax=Glycine max TaxID=3847 RepID=A0A0R0JFQ9_SOYBN